MPKNEVPFLEGLPGKLFIPSSLKDLRFGPREVAFLAGSGNGHPIYTTEVDKTNERLLDMIVMPCRYRVDC
jgi:hypothetical protein